MSVATLLDVWYYAVSGKTGWSGVSMLDDIASLICSLNLSVVLLTGR